MAFNWQTFRTRALTAIVFLVVMAAGLFWNRWSFFLLFSVIHFGCWAEYMKLVGKIDADYNRINNAHRYLVPLLGWCAVLYFTDEQLLVRGYSLTGIGIWLGAILMLVLPASQLISKKPVVLKTYAHSIMGLLYISLSIALLVHLRNHYPPKGEGYHMTLPLLVIFTIWVNDTMAYIVGSFIGKRKMSSISPNKTWEGTIGGALLAVVIMTVVCSLTGRLPAVHAAMISVLAAVSGTYGDLFESKLKRLAGVKDSGHFMPGHGGFLDRFDSLLFSGTVAWIYVQLFL